MASVDVRPQQLFAWHGQSMLVVTPRGEAGEDDGLSGLFYREARHLRTLRLELDGAAPWPCEAAAVDPTTLAFNYVHPEMTSFGGGGSGQSQDETTTDEHGTPHRALDLRLTYRVEIAGLQATLQVGNRSTRAVEVELAWIVEADFADLQEAHEGQRQQDAPVTVAGEAGELRFAYQHERLPYRTVVRASGGDGGWTGGDGRLATILSLAPQQCVDLRLEVTPLDYRAMPDADALATTEAAFRRWRDGMARVAVPGNPHAEAVLRANVRDHASFALLQGEPDEQLALQAGMPLYPALFGRDSLTAGWQAAFLDRGASLDATLTRLGRLQSDRDLAWRDEEPGRIPYQVRQGPLARLEINPYAAYYADFASPLMFVISLAHLFAWSGERQVLDRHWDTARRILDWARERGDRDGDGYLEYLTRSPVGTKNQGWKDSGNAILYPDGRPVPAPLATCELQGYWYAAQQLMAALAFARGAKDDAKAYWHAARELKERFNRDWWLPDGDSTGGADGAGFFALALDPDKQPVAAPSSNVGHCLAAGIVDDDHLPAVVGRLFAPDMFSGWGVRTLSSEHRAYNPIDYHLGSVWAVENATLVFGLRRFGFDQRAVELSRALFDLAALYPDYRIPETVGGYSRGSHPTPGAYPRANTPQLWNASAFPLLVHALLGLQPVAPLDLLVVDPVLPEWLPEVVIHDLHLAGATATLRCWRDADGASHAELLHHRGTLLLLRQPPIESLSAGAGDRFAALVESVMHH